MPQDTEWCVYRTDDGWHEVRFHDYASIYAVPGLYERLFYKILKCTSPATVRSLLEHELRGSGERGDGLRVLDLGAGNGMVGEQLADMGAKTIVGIDKIEAARGAAGRDRPGLYADYLVADIARTTDSQRVHLESFNFNCLVCVAALGFGDIPPEAFAAAYNLIEPGGWIAFNIKNDFLDSRDSTGFSRLIARMIKDGALEVCARERYRHRLATDGSPLFYVAIIGRKRHDIARSTG
jgi:predicted TPR repeat methyltransferase